MTLPYKTWYTNDAQAARACTMVTLLDQHFRILWNREVSPDDDLTGVIMDLLSKWTCESRREPSFSCSLSQTTKAVKTILRPSASNGSVFLENVTRLVIWCKTMGLQDASFCKTIISAMDSIFNQLIPRYPYHLPFDPSFSDCIDMIMQSDTANMWVWNVQHPPLDCPIFELMCSFLLYQEHPLEGYNSLMKVLINDHTALTSVCMFAVYRAFFMSSSKFVSTRLDHLAFAFKLIAEFPLASS